MADKTNNTPEDRDNTRDYDVGYGKPPKASRFKPGQSGNPRGRRKGTRNFNTYLGEELAATVTVTKDGKRVRMPKVQLIANQLVNAALKGDLKSIEALIRLGDLMSPANSKGEAMHLLSAAERDALNGYIAMLQSTPDTSMETKSESNVDANEQDGDAGAE